MGALLETLTQDGIDELELRLALYHPHALLAEVVDRLKNEVLAAFDGDCACGDLAEEVIQCDESSRSTDACAACENRLDHDLGET